MDEIEEGMSIISQFSSRNVRGKVETSRVDRDTLIEFHPRPSFLPFRGSFLKFILNSQKFPSTRNFLPEPDSQTVILKVGREGARFHLFSIVSDPKKRKRIINFFLFFPLPSPRGILIYRTSLGTFGNKNNRE